MSRTRKEPTPLLTFRAYPKGRTLYFCVFVWRTLTELREAGKRREIKAMRKVQGFVSAYRVTRVHSAGYRKRPILGEIHLAKTRCDIETVTHEATHAGLYWAAQLGILAGVKDDACTGSASDDEESLCYAVGSMVSQIGARLHRAGCYD